MSDKENKYRVPALTSGLELLTLLSNSSEPLTLTQISQALNKSTSGLFRIINCLIKEGFVIKNDAHNTFQLSFKLYELAHQQPVLKRLIQTASEHLIEFTKITGFGCHLSVLEAGEVFIPYQVQSPESISVHIREGARFLAHETTSGCMLLGMLSDEELAVVLEKTSHPSRMVQRVKNIVAKANQQKAMINSSFILKNIIDLCCLVSRQSSYLKVAITCTIIENQVSKQQVQTCLKKLESTAHKISKGIYD